MNNKLKGILFFLSLLLLTLSSCEDDGVIAGGSLVKSSDSILVGCDTFSLTSKMISPFDEGYSIYSTPDSFLLGECDSRFGTIHSDILAQFACPEGFVYPEGAEVDSVLLYLYYNTWFGNGLTPMSISLYEMDRGTFDYNTAYPNDLNISDYCSLNDTSMVLYKQRIVVPERPTTYTYTDDGVEVPYVRFRLTDAFAKRFFACQDFSSQAAYCQQFKGMYLQSNFGSAALLHVNNLNMAVHYHFTYKKDGRDTTVNDIKGFYANTEVRQVNHFTYLNHQELIQKLDTVEKNYIVSPANLYTRVSVPIKEMASKVMSGVQGKRPYINKAEIALDVLNVYNDTNKLTRDDWAQPSSYMMLILEDSVVNFFAKNRLPNDTTSMLSALASNKEDDVVSYCYTYDLSKLLTMAVRNINSADSATKANVPDYLNMLLVPVSVASSTTNSGTTSISSVKHEQTVTATVIRSANSAEKPLKLEVVYSGF